MYVFLAVAPCSFSVGGKAYKLSAGSTFTISKELGEQLRANTFPYRKHVRLMSEIQEEEVKPSEVVTLEEPKLTNPPVVVPTIKEEVTVTEVKEEIRPKRTTKKIEV